MANKDNNPVGIVTEILPNMLFKVEIRDTNEEVICYLAGKMRKAKINPIVGDKVEVILDPYHGKTTNRIVWRHSR